MFWFLNILKLFRIYIYKFFNENLYKLKVGIMKWKFILGFGVIFILVVILIIVVICGVFLLVKVVKVRVVYEDVFKKFNDVVELDVKVLVEKKKVINVKDILKE